MSSIQAGSVRPVLQVSRRPLDYAMEGVALFGLLLPIGLVMASWSSLPERIPCHFDLRGNPDGWGGRWVLIILPVASAALYLFLTIAGRMPHRYNYIWPITPQNAERQYRIAGSLVTMLKAEVMYVLAFLAWKMIKTAEGESAGLGAAFLPVVLVGIFGTILAHLIAAHRAR